VIAAFLARLFGNKPAAPPPAVSDHIADPGNMVPEPPPPDLLTPRDRDRLAGVHPDLVRIVRAARARTTFIVVEGLRSRQRQAQLMGEGKSRTMNSRHITGHAVDLVPLVDGKVSWEWPEFHPMAKAMKEEAERLGIPIVWGGDWKSFPDGPHFELSRSVYPA
jgi:peptidoglycan L-alanyl-D-glutamate endopeptidase CwlK